MERKPTVEVRVGNVVIGGGGEIVLQSMTNTDTMDTENSVAQILSIARAGGRIVRLTAPSVRDAQNLENIVRLVRERGGNDIGIVADIHFNPEVALTAARYVDKVRINPGNYRRRGDEFRELVEECRHRGVAIRIGVNHGSLSAAIVERYGDTPQGMVASAMEFLEECRRLDFDQTVVSMKSSNVRVMVHAYRMLDARMQEQDMHYPLHLGVTEAGDGLQGRVKSAVGIGTLLADGLGDTIRVSLSEPPESEIPVAAALANHFVERPSPADPRFVVKNESLYHPFEYRPRPSAVCLRLGGGQPPLLYSELQTGEKEAISNGGIAVIEAVTQFPVQEWRAAVLNMQAAGDDRPVILKRKYEGPGGEEFVVRAAADFGPLFVDGLADGIWIENPGVLQEDIDALSYQILQASRVRITQTEYIACPGCGRTLYDLQKTLADIKAHTARLKGLKIGVMGCIVNGPGEMADADYGYVGSGPGRITLYRGREVVRRNIPEAQAIDALLELINGDKSRSVAK